MHWDIFCRVIDNHGDLGVCWRLAQQLAMRGLQVRLWVDDGAALAWMAPGGDPGVAVIDWRDPAAVRAAAAAAPQVLVEAFGCDPAPELVERFAQSPAGRAWINLEYLSAEPVVERLHGLPSPVFAGPGAGLTKRFFYPGFTPATGGLLREPDLAARQARFDRDGWLKAQGLAAPAARRISLFCYEPPALADLLSQLATDPQRTRLLVTAGRAADAVRAAGIAAPADFLPYLPQAGFDHLLWACELNFVRGEDSLVRALWAGKPFVWQIYPQDDHAHHAKLDAFLDWLDAPASLRRFHHVWNGIAPGPLPGLDDALLAEWQPVALAARARALAQPDLVTQLLDFVAGAGASAQRS